MESWVTLLVILAAVASRPIEVRLWRAGRLSDRALTLLVLGRFPLVVGLFAVLSGGSLQMTLLVVAISLLPGLFLYRFMLGVIHDQTSR